MQVLADRSESLLGSQVHTNSKGAPMGYEQNTEQASLSNYTRLSEKCLFFFFFWVAASRAAPGDRWVAASRAAPGDRWVAANAYFFKIIFVLPQSQRE